MAGFEDFAPGNSVRDIWQESLTVVRRYAAVVMLHTWI